MEIRIPYGTRDLIGNDVRKKRWLQFELMNLFESYGFEEVMTPAFEYQQIYNAGFSNLDETEMYKFFDEKGDTLALRMDMTVPIARLAATKYKEAHLPMRFCYSSNVYKVKKTFAGKRTEVMDCGIELLGTQETGDLEVLAIAVDTLSKLPVETFTLEIGDVNFFRTAASMVFKDQKMIEKLADLIDRKSMVELEELLASCSLDPIIQNFFLKLPLLAGDVSILQQARSLAFAQELVDVIDRLASIYQMLEKMGCADQIRFDLGKLPHLNYYTGLIFEGFIPNAGVSILSGGRYDHLLGKFGRELPARGFSVKLDYLLEAMPVPYAPSATKVFYPQYRFLEAWELAKSIRNDRPVELVAWDHDEIVEENLV